MWLTTYMDSQAIWRETVWLQSGQDLLATLEGERHCCVQHRAGKSRASWMGETRENSMLENKWKAYYPCKESSSCAPLTHFTWVGQSFFPVGEKAVLFHHKQYWECSVSDGPKVREWEEDLCLHKLAPLFQQVSSGRVGVGEGSAVWGSFLGRPGGRLEAKQLKSNTRLLPADSECPTHSL